MSAGATQLPQPLPPTRWLWFGAIAEADTTGAAIAVHADAAVPYGKVVEVLNLGAENSIKMVLATRPSAPKASADSIR